MILILFLSVFMTNYNCMVGIVRNYYVNNFLFRCFYFLFIGQSFEKLC